MSIFVLCSCWFQFDEVVCEQLPLENSKGAHLGTSQLPPSEDSSKLQQKEKQ
jgi:hypothetical protein